MDALSLNDVDPQYSGLLNLYDSLYEQMESVALARDYFIEIAYRGVEIIKFLRIKRLNLYVQEALKI